jgi:hypothetical protein
LSAVAACRKVAPPAANAYADSRQCQSCHADVYRKYQSAGMAHSFGAASVDGIPDGAVTHAASGRRYEVRGLVQRRAEPAMELTATHVVGSGRHARTYLHRAANGEFTELPLTWYPQEKRWELSPGFDQDTPPDFTRRIDGRCLFCHSAFGAQPQAIDCQRCHGPGEAHVKRTGPIVNPAKLPPERQLDVCMQCHLETTSAELPSTIVRFDREMNSYRPGEPLTEYAVHFDKAIGSDRFEIAGHAYRLRQSACFLKSEGRLTCTTCHDPHSGIAKTATCVGCHAPHEKPDCASCHMPKRRTEDAVHVTMTDHKIQRRPRAGQVSRAAGEPIPYFPLSPRDRDIYQGAALILGGWDRQRGIERLERYADLPAKARSVLGEGYFAEGQFAKASKTLTSPYNLAQSLEREGRTDEARRLLVGLSSPEAANALGHLSMKAGQSNEAVSHYRRSILARALNPEAYGGLALALAAAGQIPEALDAARQAVALDANDPRARYNLAKLLQETGAAEPALRAFRQAIRLQPGFVEAHLALGQALGDAGRLAAAVAEFREVLKLDPNHAEARKMIAMAESIR